MYSAIHAQFQVFKAEKDQKPHKSIYAPYNSLRIRAQTDYPTRGKEVCAKKLMEPKIRTCLLKLETNSYIKR